MSEAGTTGRHPCGTYGGFQRHARAGDQPCEPCREARLAYTRDFRKRRPDTVKSATKAAKTRQQAMKRLVERHPEEFDRIHRDLLLLNLTHTDREATT